MQRRMHPKELWKRQKHFVIILGILLAFTGIYDVIYRYRLAQGLFGLILSPLIPLAIYRRYHLGICLLMFGSLLVLSYPLLGLPIFTLGIVYVSIKEVEKWLSTKG